MAIKKEFKIPNKKGFKTAHLYKAYCTKLEDTIVKLNAEIEKYEKALQHYEQYKVAIQLTIEEYCPVPYKEYIAILSISKLRAIKWKPINAKYIGFTPGQVTSISSSIVVCKLEIRNLTKTLEKHKKLRFTFAEYRFLHMEFWTAITDTMVKTGYELKLGHGLGTFYAKSKVNKGGSSKIPDWKASYANKAAIIARGGVPYDSLTGLGEKWFINHSQVHSVWWHWAKKAVTMKHYDYYSYDMVREVNRKLFRYYQQNNNVVNFYK